MKVGKDKGAKDALGAREKGGRIMPEKKGNPFLLK